MKNIEFEVLATNISLSDLGSLLDLAASADPDTAIRLVGGAVDAILNEDVSGRGPRMRDVAVTSSEYIS